MATETTSNKHEIALRLQILVVNGVSEVLRYILDQKLQNVPLNVFLAQEKSTIERLQRQMITKSQYSQLFPEGGTLPNSTDFDMLLIICLLRSLPTFRLNPNIAWNHPPQLTDLSFEADLHRLRIIHNEIVHMPSPDAFDLESLIKFWDEIEQVLLRLNSSLQNPVENLTEMLDSYKHQPIDSIKNIMQPLRQQRQRMRNKAELVNQQLEPGTEEQSMDREKDVDSISEESPDVIYIRQGSSARKQLSSAPLAKQDSFTDLEVENYDREKSDTHVPESEMMRQVLYKARIELISEMDSNLLVDYMYEAELLSAVDVEEIKAHITQTERCRRILDKVLKTGRDGYRIFKQCLEKSGHSYLVALLERYEREYNPASETEEQDVREKSDKHVPESEMMRQVLYKAWTQLISRMDSDILVDYMFEAELLSAVDVEEIRAHITQTERCRRILDRVLKTGRDGYRIFKQCLEMSGQSYLVALLERYEREYNAASKTEEQGLIPAEILQMDGNSIELYKRALTEGEEAVYNIRLMVVGHAGVGKTTLTKRLFGEDVDITKCESTEGIDVHVRRCKVSLDTKKWHIIDKDEKTEKVCHRLIKLLKKTSSHSETPEKEEEHETLASAEPVNEVISSVMKDLETQESVESMVDETPKDEPLNKETRKEGPNLKKDPSIDEHFTEYLKELIEEFQQNAADNIFSDTADLSVWDFAGQFVFYATHQVFLTRRAVYLLVTDISKLAEGIVVDDCFDNTGVKHWKIAEFVDFWLNSIHEFCHSPGKEGPPVVLVGTFADELDPETKSEMVDNYFYTLRSSLIDKPTFAHLTDEDFAIDNSIVDSNIEKLQKYILDTASKQSYWGELIPAKWIMLENIIIRLKDEGLKILHKDRFVSLNSTLPVPIESEEELELFLRFHHESGNILHFSDEKLNDSIILEPQWLIDAFKSLITVKMFCCRKPKIFKKWMQFDQSAILTNELVEAIWQREENSEFHKYKEFLLEYLEKLGFIAKPLQEHSKDEVEDFYFAPCVLKAPPPEDCLVNKDCENRTSTSRLCFKTASGFLPMAVFNKLLSACISKWPLLKRHRKSMIFCGCGIFDLKDSHTLHIYFCNHEIQIWLTRLSARGQGPERSLCLEVKAFVLNLLQSRLMVSSDIQVFVKCPTTDLHSTEDEFAFDDIVQKMEVVCNCRPDQHALPSEELTKYWQVYLHPDVDISREITDTECQMIAESIGLNWELLGLQLRLKQVTIDHIRLDNIGTALRITRMLQRWRSEKKMEATVGRLYKAMRNCSTVTLDWPAIERVFAGNSEL